MQIPIITTFICLLKVHLKRWFTSFWGNSLFIFKFLSTNVLNRNSIVHHRHECLNKPSHMFKKKSQFQVDIELVEEGNNKTEEVNECVDPPDAKAGESVSKEEKVPSNETSDNGQTGKFDDTYNELRKWVDITSTKYSLLNVINEKRSGRIGTAIKVRNYLKNMEHHIK